MIVAWTILLNSKALSSFNMAKIFKSTAASFFKESNESNKSAFASKKMNNVSCSLVDGNDVIANVQLFNLSKNMEPKESYDLIKCRKSATFIVETTLCVHDIDKDSIVSASIWKDGVWEPHILGICILGIVTYRKRPDIVP
jgi:hypothetical protein